MNFVYPSQATVKQKIWAIWTIYILRADFSEYVFLKAESEQSQQLVLLVNVKNHKMKVMKAVAREKMFW